MKIVYLYQYLYVDHRPAILGGDLRLQPSSAKPNTTGRKKDMEVQDCQVESMPIQPTTASTACRQGLIFDKARVNCSNQG
jgi:hypothetical protein